MLLSINDILELQISVVRPRLKIGSSKMSAKKCDRQKLEVTKIRLVRPGPLETVLYSGGGGVVRGGGGGEVSYFFFLGGGGWGVGGS